MTRALAHLALAGYAGLTALAAPLVPLWLAHRARHDKEDPARIPERYGRASLPRPAGAVAWCHAASVGEALSILPLIAGLRERGMAVVITTGTVSSARLLAERLPAGAVHQFLPLDRRPWADRFLDHWQPSLVIWTESELWPATLAAVAARGIPAALVNARLSDRALRGWRRWPGVAATVLAAFRVILAQSPEDAQRFAALGGHDVRTLGNLKLATPALPADPAAVNALRTALGDRPVWLAASIHPGEDAIVARVHVRVRAARPGLLTVVAPRHPPKADAMAATFADAGLRVARRSRGEAPGTEVDVYMADTLGELGVLYRVCGIVVMGKSFAVGGGQNPAEPAQLGCAVLCGPDMSNFRALTAQLEAAGGLLPCANEAALASALAALLTDPARRAAMGRQAAAAVAEGSDALARTLSVLEGLRPGR